MNYPEWAPPELVRIARGGPNKVDFIVEIAHRLCTYPDMEKAWRTLYRTERGVDEHCIDRLFSALLNVLPRMESLPNTKIKKELAEQIANSAEDLARLTLCYFHEQDPTTTLPEARLIREQEREMFPFIRGDDIDKFPGNMPDLLIKLSDYAKHWAAREQDILTMAGKGSQTTLFIRDFAELYFVPLYGSPMYTTLARFADALLDESVDATTVRSALRGYQIEGWQNDPKVRSI